MGSDPSPIVLFDGVCNLCNASVNFIIDRDPSGVFRFASLQSPSGKELLERFGVPTDTYYSLVLIHGDHLFVRSTAALRIAARLRGPWRLLYALMLVPRPVRDRIYDWIARNRYKWFGQAEACRIPTPELRSRFLD